MVAPRYCTTPPLRLLRVVWQLAQSESVKTVTRSCTLPLPHPLSLTATKLLKTQEHWDYDVVLHICQILRRKKCRNGHAVLRINFCHTRLHLGFSAKMRIWQVAACKMEPQRGIVLDQKPPTHPPTHHPPAGHLFLTST